MKQSTKNLINILCIIGIFLLVVIITLPPLLRFLLPDSDNFNNTVELELLTCTTNIDNTEKIINTHYKNKKVQKVEIRYNNVNENTIIEEKNFYNLSGVDVTENNNNIYISITPNSNNQTRLSAFFKDISEQKSIYEDGDYNYICNTTE
ncbi:MAG: hypothetical protein ACI4OT_05770 [Bacilli bacterium]